MSALAVGQPVVFKGATAQIIALGPETGTSAAGPVYRWVTLSTHVGTKRIPSDHPELVIL